MEFSTRMLLFRALGAVVAEGRGRVVDVEVLGVGGPHLTPGSNKIHI